MLPGERYPLCIPALAIALAIVCNAVASRAGPAPEHHCTARVRAAIGPLIAKSAQQRREQQFVQAMLSAQNAGAFLAACADENIGYQGRTPARTAQLAYEMQAKAVDDGTRVGAPMADPVIVTRLEQYALSAYRGRGATDADRAQAKREFFISCSLANSDAECAGLWSIFGRVGTAPRRSAALEAPTPRGCSSTNVQPRTIFAAKPVLPAGLAETHSGDVAIVVSLDSASRIVGTRVLRSSDPLLNEPALAAARASRFATEIRNCRPIAGDFVFGVSFTLL